MSTTSAPEVQAEEVGIAPGKPKRPRASTSKIKPGDTSISRATPTKLPDGTYRLDWVAVLPDGRTIKRRSKGAAPSIVKRRANETAERLFASGGPGARWEGKSQLSDYIREVSVPAVEAADLRENSRKRYRAALALLAGECSQQKHRHKMGLDRHTIGTGMKFRALESCLQELAKLHGSETARQCRTVLGKYVIQQLQRDEAIPGNPLGGMSIDLRSERPKPAGPRGGVALTRTEWERVIDYLLALDPAAEITMRQGRWSREDRIAKRRATIDVSLVQAATGLRQAEALALTWGDVETDDDGQVIVTVRPEVSKTHRGRRVPVLHDGVAERILARQNAARGRARAVPRRALVFGSPADPSKPWDRTNAQAATTVLYKQMHERLGIAAFETERSHVWRATLNSMLLDLPEIVRASYFGHDVEINRSAYTDLTDVSGMVAAARRLRAV